MLFSASLDVSNVWIERSDRDLCRDLSFTLRAGEVLRVLGDNGAGKSSLLKVVAGAMTPLEGRIMFNGQDVTSHRALLQQSMVYIGHGAGLKSMLTIEENLLSYCPATSPEQMQSVLDILDLANHQETYVKALSAGQSRRVALARLWLSQCPLWLLDEPFASLDVSGVAVVESKIQQHINEGGMVLLTTHQALSSVVTRDLVLS
ncbi:cytochrome c biogenesis heme-transporting ATPase CcmA [Marinomonas algarum]|uniref:Cytochrome c biogenesis heme-transporting ATPase CcmA n=1 Tax=Marinomonas algarum TaxID=2883105 RepID=A0A9X1IQC3_9GAMM|nr:cytochrome c biogenesis heme-transporting ATPase CcmA [Marinomonas algarum]MCB5161993.1 cytochrome c biogenesis heme-transporting ATPase CcmA [Marinomonas algarum]